MTVTSAAIRWQRQARVLDKLYAPTCYTDALGDNLSADVFGPEDAERALDVTIPKAIREGPTRYSIRTGSLITQSESAKRSSCCRVWLRSGSAPSRG